MMLHPSWEINGAGFFKDYRFIRNSLIDPKEYRNAFLDSSLKNVITSEELQRQMFGERYYDLIEKAMKDEEMMNESSINDQNLQSTYDKFSSNMKTFFKNIDSGVFIYTPEQLREMQKEAGADYIVEYYEELYENLKRLGMDN